MKTIFSLLSLLLLLSGHALSQNQHEAERLLDKAYAIYESSEGISLSFKSTIMDKDGETYAPQSGKAYLKGDKFKLETGPMEIWFDGITQWVLMKDVNEVNITTPTGDEIAAISPLALLGIYKNGFRLKAPASKKINGKSASVINMEPVTPGRDFKSITAAIDKKSGHIIQVSLVMSNGMKNRIDISDYSTNHQFNSSMFKFNKNDHPGVEMVDLR